MTKTKNKGGNKMTAKELQVRLLKFLLSNPKRAFSARQIIKVLKLTNNKDSVTHALQQLALAGSVRELSVGKFGVALDKLTRDEFIAAKETQKTVRPAGKIQRDMRRKTIEGRVDMTRSGSAYIVSDMLDTDVYVSPKYLQGALNGDTVSVLIFPERPHRKGRTPRKPEGEVLKVLKRAKDFFLGTIRMSRKHAMFIPDDENMPIDIFVPADQTGKAKDGDTVVVHVTDWQEGKGRVPKGKVTQVLGNAKGNDFEMNKILLQNGFELSHSDAALQEASRIPETIPANEIARRRDFRGILTCTIDPLDARDFDDALSIQKLENGDIEVGVHIADVTHYLRPGSSMDEEAYKRSTSVYLVDRVCPMLPEKLSNNLCSLVPNADRLAFSAVFTFDKTNKIVKRWFGKTVIHSDMRFTYEQAQSILEKKPDPEVKAHPQFDELKWGILSLNKIALELRKQKVKNGAINFDSEEVRFRLAEDGTPLEAYVKERKEAHLLIEDFMLLANKEVAFYIDQKGRAQQEIPFVYRVHDLPDMEKVADFARFAAEMGHPMKVSTPKQIAAAYNKLMEAAKENERLKLLEPLAIRTMAKAVYSTENIGHYGLAFSHYSHFTSPIRRYSDVLAHRILEQNLDGRTHRVDKNKLEEQCKHISAQEKRAADAERESVKYKQVEWMKNHVGEVFDGVISGMIDRGMFVELPESKAEGMVQFATMDDQYVLDEGNLRARGRRFGVDYRMGQKVRVRIISADLDRRQIEMKIEDE
ncbi:MAG: ribonuclease R [Saprospiraceae bacterium]